ncbi:phosphatase PAP2 family protein [Paenibacillus hemerocallicola]|uniref:Phosphatase PAP2 family protein n=1 Tax=Paenibacillus hemerocallicola TaxID=1172614 RepID=A0A5C4SW10_9BACL|nr:phosphatase PAP2 family protein [Paenibacillus hemerocallicola]TNJ57146.1 phosphatase PAP2 family protein [Paenibacillus hemerocallicola]
MSRVINWLLHRERQLFYIVNRKMRHSVLDSTLSLITHMGGATFTISVTLLIGLFGSGSWSLAGWQSLAALAISHIPVAIVKRKYPRRRPYLVLPETNIGKNPLTDHSFPSGHSTAIFSVVVPFIAAAPVLGLVLLPLASLVSLSRIYLGLHYPSDCAAGIAIGTCAGFGTIAMIS